MSPERQRDRNRYIATLYRLFTQTNIEEIRGLVKDGECVEKTENEESADGGDGDGGSDIPSKGQRGDTDWRDRWEESMESQADDNTKMIYENRELLERLDERSAWTMRLLVGVFVTIIGSAALQVFVF